MSISNTMNTLVDGLTGLAAKRGGNTYLVVRADVRADGRRYVLEEHIDIEFAADHLHFTDGDGIERIVPYSQITEAYIETLS